MCRLDGGRIGIKVVYLLNMSEIICLLSLPSLSVAYSKHVPTPPSSKIHHNSFDLNLPLVPLSVYGDTNHQLRLSSFSNHIDLIRNSTGMLENKTLIVCVVVREPFVIYNEPEDSESYPNHQHGNDTDKLAAAEANIDNYSGVAVEVVKRLAHIFKFKTRIMRPQDGQFGSQLSDDKLDWSGLMGVLARKEADIGLTALSVTMSRAQAIDFTRAYYVETVAILLRTPEEVQNYLAIFEPFSQVVWFVLLTTVLVLILLVTLMIKLEDEQNRQHKLHKMAEYLKHHVTGDEGESSGAVNATLSNNFIETRHHEHSGKSGDNQSSWLQRFYYAVSCVINILFNKDIQRPPHQTPIRILVCVWWLSTIVIVNIYLGILFGQLVVPRRPKSIETLEELVNQDQIKWCVTNGSAIYDLFKHSDPNTVYGQLGLRMQYVSSADQGVESVIKSGWAFIRETSILTFKVAQEHNRLKACKMQFGREHFHSVGFGIGLVKDSKYLDPFNSALTLMIEHGFVSHWQSLYWPTRNQYTECETQATEGEPLSIKHFISIYLVCSSIVATSAAILLYQNTHKQLFSRNRDR